MSMTTSICDKRGHYFLPIEIPPAPGAYWTTLLPQPERKLYCRRCGMLQPLVSASFPTLTLTNHTITTTYNSCSIWFTRS